MEHEEGGREGRGWEAVGSEAHQNNVRKVIVEGKSGGGRFGGWHLHHLRQPLRHDLRLFRVWWRRWKRQWSFQLEQTITCTICIRLHSFGLLLHLLQVWNSTGLNYITLTLSKWTIFQCTFNLNQQGADWLWRPSPFLVLAAPTGITLRLLCENDHHHHLKQGIRINADSAV